MPNPKSILTIIPARVGSNRLPGKVLMPISGRPLLQRLIERVRHAQLAGPILVATTHHAQDDAISRLCWRLDIPCYRGDPDDVLDRVYRAARVFNPYAIVLIPSNCPLIDPAIIDRVIATYLAQPTAAYISNLHPPTYPEGNDVELVTMDALAQAWRGAWGSCQRELISPYILENDARFSVINVVMPQQHNYARTYRWAVDYAQDLLLVQAIYSVLAPQNPRFNLQDILALLKREPHLATVNATHIGAGRRQQLANALAPATDVAHRRQGILEKALA